MNPVQKKLFSFFVESFVCTGNPLSDPLEKWIGYYLPIRSCAAIYFGYTMEFQILLGTRGFQVVGK